MKFTVNEHVVLRDKPEGPLEPYIEAFAEYISDQGYSVFSIHRHVLRAACFSGWLMKKGVEQQQITSEHPHQYLHCRSHQVRLCAGNVAALEHLMKFLRNNKLIPDVVVVEPPLTSLERCARAYEQYLRDTRGLAEVTIVNYVPFICAFLEHRFGTSVVRLSNIRANDIVEFVQVRVSRMQRNRTKLLTCALRSFLNYARYSGEVTLDLAAAVPVVPNWSRPSIPRAISADQINRLLSSIDRSSATGRRDYAILLLLARLGLRSSEVVFIELENIDWDKGTLSVQGKGGRFNTFPLPPDVGKAIAEYLKNGRPTCSTRRLFVRVKAPIQGFRGPCGVGSVVRHALKRCDVDAPTFGAHQFRHGLATEMLRGGASLPEIGDVLGHQNPQTTMIYAKVDLEALRSLAIAWPGAVR